MPYLRRLIAMVVLLALAPMARADSDRWYVVELFGSRSGSMHSTEVTRDGVITTSNVVSFGMKRGETQIRIEMAGEFVETPDGKPVSMKTVQKLGQTEVVQNFIFQEDEVKVTSTQSGNTTSTSQPRPKGEWLTPAAADRYATQRFKSGAKEIVVRSIDPMSGLKVETSTRTIGEKTSISVLGRQIEAVSSVLVSTASPGVKSKEFLDVDGVLIRGETNLGGISMLVLASTKEEAAGDSGRPLPEVFLKTFIKPEHPLANARSLKQATYLVSVPDGELPEFPATGSQAVNPVNATSARVTVNAAHFSPAPKADAGNAVFLSSSSACNTGDEKIKELAARAVRKLEENATPAEKAEACRRFTYKFIKKKNLGVGFGTATEVARTREGDCSEHGVFLAAMLRANGIPARVASGLIYADAFAGAEGIFGYHMWAQALLEVDGEKRWVDLDATLPDATPYDATHICLGVSTLEDNEGWQSMSSLAQVLGRLAIKVEETK